MRFDTPVYFRRTTPGAYDPTTGDYGPDTVAEEKHMASVTDCGAKTMRLIYGELRQGCKVVRIQNHVDMAFDRIRIGDKLYRDDTARDLRIKQTFVVSEVP